MAEETAAPRVRTVGLVTGPVLALAMLLLPPPPGLSAEGWAAAAVTVLMAVWWLTEAAPLAATALVPVLLLPLLGVSSLEAATRPYADPLIFLFLGGFMLARAIERWHLHERLAASLMRATSAEPASQIAALMVATAFLSMWVSNTAAAMVMLPVGVAIATGLQPRLAGASARERADTGAAISLAIAYAATIGGMATLIGTPPNALFAAYMRTSHGITIDFARWMLLGVPVAVVLLVITWLVLTRFAFRLPQLGPATAPPAIGRPPAPMSNAERRVTIIVAATALLWTLSPLLKLLAPGLPLSDAGIAIAAALALFVIPAGGRAQRPLLEWRDVAGIKWDVLLLVGGGLALAAAIQGSGLAQWLGSGFGALRDLPLPLLVLALMLAIVYLGELASNTAVAAIFLPVAGAAAIGLGESPLALAVPVVLATSLGFMLPVATPPNAIVYSSGLVTSRQMLRAGAVLDVATTLVVAAIALTLGRLLLG